MKDISEKFPTQIMEQSKIPTGTAIRADTSPEHQNEPKERSKEASEGDPSHDEDRSVVKESVVKENNEAADNSCNTSQSVPPQSKDTPKLDLQGTEHRDESTNQPDSKQHEAPPQSSWGWGWGSIGSLLTSSVSAVSDSAQSLTKGIGSIVTNVEDALGIPQPEEMTREPPAIPEKEGLQEEEEEEVEKKDEDNETCAGGSGMSILIVLINRNWKV